MVAVTSSLVGAQDPQIVQVSATGLTAGVVFTVTGSIASGFTWTVPGGNGQEAAATTVLLADTIAPIGQAVTYTVEQAGSTATSTPLTVTVADPDADVLVQSLTGSVVAGGFHDDNADPRAVSFRQAFFPVAGRAAPVVRFDMSTTETGQLVMETTGAATTNLLTLVASGEPVAIRTVGQVRDLDPVQIVMLTAAPRQLVDAVSNRRRWVLSFQVITDPEPSTLIPPSTWDDFDAVYATLTWADFDSEWSTLTWDQFDATDWATH